MKCILCGNKLEGNILSDKVRDSNNYKVIKCSNCNHVQLTPIPQPGEIENFYNFDMQTKNIEGSTDIEKKRIKAEYDTNSRFRLVSLLTNKDTSILDVGCGYGFFMQKLEKKGYKTEGVEISSCRREIAEKYCNCNIHPILPLNKKYDLVTLFHVLEHVDNPIEFLRKLSGLLKPNGILLIEVPNVESYTLSSKYCNEFFWQMAHISYFSYETLNYTIEKAGIKEKIIFGKQRYSIDSFINWAINGKPQINKPEYRGNNELDNCYVPILCKKFACDTLCAIGGVCR